ncbi:MAG: hypothetical protein ACJA0E_002084 [Bermanella sp.]|jgi:hypothetical protein
MSMVSFIYSFFWHLDYVAWPESSLEENQRFFIVVAFEVISLLCWIRLQSIRNKRIVNMMQKKLETGEKNIIKLKKRWIEKTLGISSSEFFSLAKDIDSMLALKQRNKSPFSFSLDQVINLIFTSESKNRVLAMFMGICAGLVGLSISSGASIHNTFSFYKNYSPESLILISFFISIFILLTYLVFRYALLILFTALSAISGRFDGLNAISNMRTKYFVHDLVFLHELPKGRGRVQHS